MSNLIQIDPIAVKDKHDVVKALTILERLGINRMNDEQKQQYLDDERRTVEDNFMVQEDNGGFRIQSHYIGHGISIESLEKQVDDIINDRPDICEKILEIQNLENELYIMKAKYEGKIEKLYPKDTKHFIELKEF